MVFIPREVMIFYLKKGYDNTKEKIKQIRCSIKVLSEELYILKTNHKKNDPQNENDIKVIGETKESLYYIVNNILKPELNNAKESIKKYKHMTDAEYYGYSDNNN